jgi:hypothetical protein
MNVYSDIEERVRALVLARAKGRGRSPAFVERCVEAAVWIARKHGPYGRIFAACRMALSRLWGWRDCQVRTVVAMLQSIGFLSHLPRANGHDRKFRSPEYAAFQFALGPDFANLFPNDVCGEAAPIHSSQNKVVCSWLPVSGGIVPARTWNSVAPELRLPSAGTGTAIRKAAQAALAAMKGQPMPRLSEGALRAALRRW